MKIYGNSSVVLLCCWLYSTIYDPILRHIFLFFSVRSPTDRIAHAAVVVVVVLIAHQLLFCHHALSRLRKRCLMLLETMWEEWGDTESFAAVVLGRLSSGTDVDMPCRGLLSTFFRQQVNQPAVGSAMKRRLHQNHCPCSRAHHFGCCSLFVACLHHLVWRVCMFVGMVWVWWVVTLFVCNVLGCLSTVTVTRQATQ